MPKQDIEKNHTTRSKGGYIPFKYENKNFNTSFFPNTLKLWNKLPKQLKVQDVECFKISIKSLVKPKRLDGLFLDRVNKHKYLGLLLTSTLVCLRANRKLSVLRSVNILNRQTLDLLYKLTVRSVIDYALPVYYKSLTQSQIGRLENIVKTQP